MLLIIPGVVQRRVSMLVIGAFFVNIAVLSTLLERQTSQQQQQQVLPVVRHYDHEQRDPPFLLNRNRFPLYGTPAFQRICPWAGVQTQTQIQIQRTQLRDSSSLPSCENCTIFAPPPDDMEGISSWIARVMSGYIMAKQTGCSLIIHYGEGITISDMFIPILDDDDHHHRHDEDDRSGSGSRRRNDWRMPPNFACQQNCYVAEFAYPQGGGPGFRRHDCTASNRGHLAAVPAFRTPYLASFVKQGTGLNATLPGFAIETSMACAFGSMFQLSPKVATYQPNIFTTILPALQDDATVGLVLSLYIRTGHTEQITHPEWIDRYRAQAESIVQCALHVEALQLQQQQQHDENAKVVWMLVTDSPYVKTFVSETYTSSVGPNRTILTTQSRGAHTKPRGQPSMADFVEGFLDWYLIGESDIVISDNAGPSFGNTASFRTARPHYKVPDGNQQGRGGGGSVTVCSKVEPSLEYVHR